MKRYMSGQIIPHVNEALVHQLSPAPTRKHCGGNIMFPMNVSLFAHLGKHCCGNKIPARQNIVFPIRHVKTLF